MRNKLVKSTFAFLLMLVFCFSLFGSTSLVLAADVEYTITYTNTSATTVVAHWGINGWNSVQDVQMTSKGGGEFELKVSVPNGTTLNYCFHITAPTDFWDNNGGRDWSVLVGTPVPAGITVHFKRPSTWGTDIKIYYWNMLPSGEQIAWPGEAMESEGEDWYKFTIPAVISANIIFNDGNGHQTPDLFSNTTESWYYTDNLWYDSNPDNNLPPPPSFNDPDNLITYQIMVEAFQDGDHAKNYNTGYGPSAHRGDLKGVKNALPYIKSLGVNAIWMTPIFNSNGNSALDATGYFTQNYFEIDPKFGSMRDAKELVREAHRLGMYVFLDGVFGHHKNVPIPASPSGYYPTGGNDPVSYPGSLDFYKEVATWWIDKLEIDGWRLDQAYQVPIEYWKEIREAVEAKCQERKNEGKQWGTLGYMVGEIWRSEKEIQSQGYGKNTDPGLHSCFDFPLRYRLVSTLATKEKVNEDKAKGQPASFLNEGYNTHKVYSSHAHPNLMLTNHDLVRFGDLIQRAGYGGKENPDYWNRHKAAFSFMAAYTGPITIYYGDEIGDEVPNFVFERDSGYYDDHASRSAGQISGFDSNQTDLKNYVTSLMKLRKEHPALYDGKRKNLRADNTIYVDFKSADNDKVVYVLNTGSSTSTISIPQEQVGGTSLKNAITGDIINASDGNYTVSVDKLNGMFLLVQ
ncbi:MAG: alpha-amylase family glycosyl hydrolase [Clostridia bacterium]|nr:alpha-amylase family glycosyl hydrolase [Clostridia bacterium]